MSDGLPTNTVITVVACISWSRPSEDVDAKDLGDDERGVGGIIGRDSAVATSLAAADASDRLSRIPCPGTTSRSRSASLTPSALADSKAESIVELWHGSVLGME